MVETLSGDWQVRAQAMRDSATALAVTDPARVQMLRQSDQLVFGAMIRDALERPPAINSGICPPKNL